MAILQMSLQAARLHIIASLFGSTSGAVTDFRRKCADEAIRTRRVAWVNMCCSMWGMEHLPWPAELCSTWSTKTVSRKACQGQHWQNHLHENSVSHRIQAW